jgi:hypothetical protein
VLLCGALGCACSEATAPSPTSAAQPSYQALVELDAWRSVARADDPFLDDPEAAPDCLLAGFRVEADQQWLEVDTGACNWVTLTTSARHAVDVGQLLRLRVSHYDLDAASPAAAELKLWFGDCEAWSESIPIPSAAKVDEEELASPCTLPQNAAIFFHVHNHGQNTYQLQALEVLR